MADFTDTTTVGVPADALFSYLSEVGNLPRYFERMSAAERTGDDEVRTTAELPDGRHVEGEAWFRVAGDANRIEWGSEGDSGYHGSLEVRPSGADSELEVHLHTEHAGGHADQVQAGLSQTLANIKRQVEGA